MEMMSLPTLVDAVRQSADSPLDRIATALMISEELTSSADDLIGHFVSDARQAGCSWTEIGHRIGVSKQAARQRFGQRPVCRRTSIAGLPSSPTGSGAGFPVRRNTRALS